MIAFSTLAEPQNRTGHEPTLLLLVERARVLEPAFEVVTFSAIKCSGSFTGLLQHADTSVRPSARRFEAPAVVQRRNFGASAATSAGSMYHHHTGLGTTLREDAAPRIDDQRMAELCRRLSCLPPCAAANTKQPFSMARARKSTCQCASPVCRVNADGIARNDAPASASAR